MYSPAREKQMVWLASHMAYVPASEAFQRLTQRAVPASAIWQATQQHGARLKAQDDQTQAATSVERLRLPPAGHDHAVPKAVSVDGGKVHVRGEGWKEFKTGTVADIACVPVLKPELGEWEDEAHAINITYRAVLGDVTAFAPALWALAVASQIPTATLVAITADGADWIWNLVTDLFPNGVQIVDWYHATEYLARAAEALFPKDAQAAHRWQRERRHDLFLGAVHKIIDPLQRAGLTTQADYFRRHARRMQYQTFREEAYPIGSGTVESGIKQFKQRLAGPGMRWSRAGVERMLVLRALVLSDTFDAHWAEN